MPTLFELMQGCAEEVDFFDLLTTTAQAEERYQLVLGELADGELPARTFGSIFAYVLDGMQAGEQRRVDDGGYDPATGTLTVTRAYSGTVADCVRVALLGLVPAVRVLGEPGWREHANACLRDLWVERGLAFTGVATHTSYDVTATYPWLTDRRQVTDLLNGPTTATDYALPGDNLRGVRNDGGRVWLDLWSGYPVGQAFELPAKAPGHTWIRRHGQYQQVTDGLIDDDDATPAPYDLLRLMMLERAYRRLAAAAPATEASTWRQQHAVYAAAAATLKRRYLDPGPTQMRLTGAVQSAWPKGLFG